MNVQQSIEKILMTICQQNRKIILNSMSNPETFASLIDPLADKNQFQIIDRGTSSEVFECKEKILIPQITKYCCKNLPVLYFGTNNGIRRIVEECNLRECTNTLAMMFRTIEGNYICQYENKIKLCKKPRKLDPSISIKGRLTLFTK